MRSKSTFRYLSVVVLLSLNLNVVGQLAAGLAGNFGVDGDVQSGLRMSGTFNGGGTHDWFRKSGGGSNQGFGVIDTTGAAGIYNILSTGQNYQFTKAMEYGQYTVQDGFLMLDARYGRDQYGYSNDSVNGDKTAFPGGHKNGANPSTTWVSGIAGISVNNKADLIDTYVHFRRNGTIVNGTSSSDLIAVFGASTVANSGTRYFDVEFYSSPINYNSTTGTFSNSGPTATGGHTAWEFNPNGSIKKFGDMTISFAFSGSNADEISLWLWVAKTDYTSLDPRDFDFVPGEFNGDNSGSLYGYVKIQPNIGNTSNAWGVGNTAIAIGPTWGTTSKTLGANGTGYFFPSYDIGQFAEAGINLSKLGIDPAYIVGGDPCTPVFTRVMFKSRSSQSFTSSLQDFTGPFAFLDAPQAPASITPPANLKCNVSTVNLSPATSVSGAVYNWTTTNGNITSDPTQPTITINKAGKYYLTSSIYSGCPTNIDSTIVTADYYKPVATALSVGEINLNDPSSFAHIQGGDVAASNFATPYGGSVGLDWKWTGPNGYTSSARNNTVTKAGVYNLELTEQRNGCKEFAVTAVPAFTTLPVKITEFSATKKENDNVKINWKVMDETPSTVELMRSYSGNDFSVIAIELPLSASQEASYNDNVANRNGNKVYYQLRITEQSGAIVYSKIINITFGATNSSPMVLSPNPATNYTVIGITSTIATTGQIQLVDMAGRMLQQKNVRMEKGSNQIMLSELEKLKPGIYMVRIIMEGEFKTQKLLIQ